MHCLRTDRGAVTRALSLARAFAERSRLAPEAGDRLALIVEEWLSNVVEHGGAAPGARIVMRFQRGREILRLTVSDAGRPFDPRAAEFKGPNLQRGGGAGIALIQAWCQIADYRRIRGRNRLVFEVPLA